MNEKHEYYITFNQTIITFYNSYGKEWTFYLLSNNDEIIIDLILFDDL